MRWAIAIFVVLASSVPAAPQSGPAPSERARVIAALERLIATGEPRHSSHDEGQWLQEEVDRAFERKDAEVIRLAKRAAQPLTARLSTLISSTDSVPHLSIGPTPVLDARNGGRYQQEVFASLDGGEAVKLASQTIGNGGGFLDELLPRQAVAPGRHSLRLTAQLTFADKTLGVETRELPEIVYGIYQKDAVDPSGVRTFIDAARSANVHDLDPALPDAPFGAWLKAVAKAAPSAEFEPSSDHSWEGRYCEDAPGEERPPSFGGDVCAVALVAVADGHNGIIRVWIRTGRIERVDRRVLWTPSAPAVAGIQLRTTDVSALSELASMLSMPAAGWPVADISVSPEDIFAVREGDRLRVQAIVRNGGVAAARDVQIHITASVDTRKRSSRTFIRTVPALGMVELSADLPFGAPYGEVMVHALQISDHTRQEFWSGDPTPDDEAVFRVIGAELAPAGYAQKLRELCGYGCRGY